MPFCNRCVVALHILFKSLFVFCWKHCNYSFRSAQTLTTVSPLNEVKHRRLIKKKKKSTVGFAFQVDLNFPLGVMGSAASNYKGHKEPVSREGDLYQQPGGWNHKIYKHFSLWDKLQRSDTVYGSYRPLSIRVCDCRWSPKSHYSGKSKFVDHFIWARQHELLGN